MGHREAVEVKERDLAKLERDSKEIDVSMQGLKPQIMKLTERKNYYYKLVMWRGSSIHPLDFLINLLLWLPW